MYTDLHVLQLCEELQRQTSPPARLAYALLYSFLQLYSLMQFCSYWMRR